MKLFMGLAGLIVACAGTSAWAYQETWDDPGAANHNWVTDYDEKQVWHPMFHDTTGGVSGGHVWTDLDDLLGDVFPGGANESSPAWLQNPEPDQSVDFTGQAIRVATKLDPGSSLGGTLHFYIGTWSNGGHFFYHAQPIVPGADGWLETVMPVGEAGDDSAWADLYVVNEDLQADDIFDQPEEYGFMILVDNGLPTGTLRFDNFEVVPEPAGLALLAAGCVMLTRRRG
jgi:hypothetical protein